MRVIGVMDKYLGRERVVRNLRDHLIQGASEVVAGEPGMGKSTLFQKTVRFA